MRRFVRMQTFTLYSNIAYKFESRNKVQKKNKVKKTYTRLFFVF